MTASSPASAHLPAPSNQEETAFLGLALAHADQGLLVIDAQQHVRYFNPQVCVLLDLPPELLTGQPTIQDVTQWQSQRGDFGPQDSSLESSLRTYMQRVELGGHDAPPDRYQRVTHTGLTLDVRSDVLSDGSIVRVFTDITASVLEHAAHVKLNQLTTKLQILAKIGGWEIDMANQRILWTEGTYRIFEADPATFVPSLETVRPLFTPESLLTVQATYRDTVHQPATHDFVIEMFTLTGRRIWIHSHGNSVWRNGKIIQRTAIVHDVTERTLTEQALRQSESRWKAALESTGDGLWDWDLQTGREYSSPSLLKMFGFDDNHLPDSDYQLYDRTHPDDRDRIRHDHQAHFDGLTPTYANEHRVLCQDGSWKWVLSRGMVINRDAQGRPLRMIGTHTDITERKRAESLVWEQAHFDSLTGLPNRRMMQERLDQEIRKCHRNHLQLALLFIDLDHFKEVNDTLGHDQGDVLLTQAARRIQHCLREVDTVARMGGDEFTVIISELSDVAHLHAIFPKLLKALSESFQLGEDQVFVSASIGITVYPNDGEEIETLLKNADQALYVAKGEGRNRFSFFTPALQEAANLRAQLTHDLRAALQQQQFRVVYQPIVELATGRIYKAEALVRWQHPVHGLISPAAFIPVAEASGLIVDIGEWVFHQAAIQVQAWRNKLHPQFQISINKSPIQFERPNPAHTPWIKQLAALNLPGESIVVEITEGLLLSDSDGVVEQLLNLREDGIQVSLDDFGTGYSSLSYLQRFDIDFVKIDQSFVRHLVPDSTDLVLCQAIIAMAHALGMTVVAEGVETEQQRNLLVAAGCDYAQGYFYSRPVTATEFETLFETLQ
jgi:diguanylate cyclase (GGDEF)-like protein/PAS domain S-box-containing protein